MSSLVRLINEDALFSMTVARKTIFSRAATRAGQGGYQKRTNTPRATLEVQFTQQEGMTGTSWNDGQRPALNIKTSCCGSAHYVILFIKQHKTENSKEKSSVTLVLGTVSCVSAAASQPPSISFPMSISNTYKKLRNGKHNSSLNYAAHSESCVDTHVINRYP